MDRRSLAVAAVAICVLLMIEFSDGEIHRAKKSKPNLRSKTSKYPQSDDIQMSGKEDSRLEILFFGHTRETWIYAVVSAILVGLSGIFPLLVIPIDAGKALQKGAAHHKLDLLLSFAVGGLLGDVFLHLLPEAWAHVHGHDHQAHMRVGLWIIVGLLTFLIIEKAFPEGHGDETAESETTEHITLSSKQDTQTNGQPTLRRSARNKGKIENGSNGQEIKNGHSHTNGTSNGVIRNGNTHATNKVSSEEQENKNHIKTSGWLNLMANFIDNFTHGLAVAGSYCVDTKTGVITTAAILLHEIPHEIGDFAILLRAGFDRWRAAKAQFITAFGGLLGAIAALCAESAQQAGDSTAWILPFTSGGFIYIALVTVVPDLLKEENGWKSVKQVLCLVCGIFVMAGVTLFC